jgi:hypothetical protein
MEKADFRVHTSLAFDITFLILTLAFFALAVAAVLIDGAEYTTAQTVFVLCVPLLGFASCVLFLVCDLLWRITVDETKVEHRTIFGKHHSFDLSDITKVVCKIKHHRRVLNTHEIILSVCSKKVTIPSGKIGFARFAGYLLENAENGTIKSSAASKTCKKELSRLSMERPRKEKNNNK